MPIHVSFGDGIASSLVDAERIRRLVSGVLADESVSWSTIGIIFTGHEQLRELNRDFLGHDCNTDVLSFLIDVSDEGIEGEVYVDLETAMERHAEFSTTLRNEIERYVIHGLLHLAGHDDATTEQKDRMHELESGYLEAFS